MHKKLLAIVLLSAITQANSDHGSAMISHELGQLNQTLINNQPTIQRNLNTSINEIQKILSYDDPYDYQEKLDKHFMTLDASIEAVLVGDPTLRNECKANLAFLRRLLQQSTVRSTSTQLKERFSKLAFGVFNSLFGVLLVGYGIYGIDSLIKKRDTDLYFGVTTGDERYSTSIGFLMNPSKENSYKRALFGIPMLLTAGISVPIFYVAAKALKRCVFYNEHAKNRENCIKEYAQREQELEKNLAHVLN